MQVVLRRLSQHLRLSPPSAPRLLRRSAMSGVDANAGLGIKTTVAARTALAEMDGGAFKRKASVWRDQIKEGGRFPPESGRYHLCVTRAPTDRDPADWDVPCWRARGRQNGGAADGAVASELDQRHILTARASAPMRMIRTCESTPRMLRWPVWESADFSAIASLSLSLCASAATCLMRAPGPTAASPCSSLRASRRPSASL